MVTLQICLCYRIYHDSDRRKKASAYDDDGNMIWRRKNIYISNSISKRYFDKLFWMREVLLWIV